MEFPPNFTETFSEFLTRNNKNIPEWILNNKKNWNGCINVISSQYNISDDMKDKLSKYLDLYYMYYTYKSMMNLRAYNHGNKEEDINYMINEAMKSILDKLPDMRSPVLRKVYNYRTKSMEYELEDGNFITIKEDIKAIKYTIDENSFPIEFIRHINQPLYRGIIINGII
jgi:hypothetical protein